MDENLPNPGSVAAREMGCTCPIIDNHYGAGVPFVENGEKKMFFWYSSDCPVHLYTSQGDSEEA